MQGPLELEVSAGDHGVEIPRALAEEGEQVVEARTLEKQADRRPEPLGVEDM